MPAISQKGRRQSDEKATLIYYKQQQQPPPLNFTAFRASRESHQRMILNGGKKTYNVKLCLFLFWNYFPMIKKKIRARTPTSLECVTQGRRVHSIIAISLSPGRTPKLSRASSLYT